MPSIWSCLCIKHRHMNVTRRKKPWKKRGFNNTTSSSDISINAYRRVTSRGGFDVIFTGTNATPLPIGTDGHFDGNTMTKLLEDTGAKKRRRVQDIFTDVPLVREHRVPSGNSNGSTKYTTESSKGASKYTTEYSEKGSRHTKGYYADEPLYTIESSKGGSRYVTGYSKGTSKYTTTPSDEPSRCTTPYSPQKKNILTRIPGIRNTFLGQSQDSESMYGYIPKAMQDVYVSTALEGRHVEDYFSDCRMNAALGKFASADMCQNMERMWRENRIDMVPIVNTEDSFGNDGRVSMGCDIGEDSRTGLRDDFDVIQTSKLYSSEPLVVGTCPTSAFSSEALFVCGSDNDMLY